MYRLPKEEERDPGSGLFVVCSLALVLLYAEGLPLPPVGVLGCDFSVARVWRLL